VSYSTSFDVVTSSPTPHLSREISWLHDDVASMVFNVDGSAFTNFENVGLGGLVRNHEISF
jgi:hypothetical protein